MKKEDKELLLKDLSARLPYGVKGQAKGMIKFFADEEVSEEPWTLTNINVQLNTFGADTQIGIPLFNRRLGKCNFKPYLFPLSSMTKEQYEEWCNLEAEPLDEILTRNSNGEKMSTLEHHLLIAKSLTDAVNYCYKNHFDIYGLIPMGLAEDATGKNIY